MTLIGILVALLLERMLGHLAWWGRPVLFLQAMKGLRVLTPSRVWTTALVPVAVVVVPSVLVFWLRGRIEGPLMELVFSAAMLLLCLGPRDLAEDVHDLLQARERNDLEKIMHLSRALQRGPNPGDAHRNLLGALFIQSHEKLFGVLIWFFVLGPAGAVAYRLASRLPRYLSESIPDSGALRMADLLHAMFAWVPVRLTAVVYGFAGSLDDALQAWRRLMREPEHVWRTQTWAIMAEVPAASLAQEESDGAPVVPPTLEAMMQEVLRMQARALLILLAAFTLVATGTLL